jgi:hypothetical protein
MANPAEPRLWRLAVKLGTSVAPGEVEKLGELNDEAFTLVLGVFWEVGALDVLITELIEAIEDDAAS